MENSDHTWPFWTQLEKKSWYFWLGACKTHNNFPQNTSHPSPCSRDSFWFRCPFSVSWKDGNDNACEFRFSNIRVDTQVDDNFFGSSLPERCTSVEKTANPRLDPSKTNKSVACRRKFLVQARNKLLALTRQGNRLDDEQAQRNLQNKLLQTFRHLLVDDLREMFWNSNQKRVFPSNLFQLLSSLRRCRKSLN